MEQYAVPSLILMEHAAMAVCEVVDSRYGDVKRITVLCGSGNNGGDGFAVARILSHRFRVTCLWIGSVDSMSFETRTNFSAMKKHDVHVAELSSSVEIETILRQTDLFIDALLGVGGSENLRGGIEKVVSLLSSYDVPKIAVDLPTGLNAFTGKAHAHSIRANVSVTFGAVKRGMLLNDGPEVCGEVVTSSIGIPRTVVEQVSSVFALEEDDIENMFPSRLRRGTKYSNGRTLVVAGSHQFPGAAALCANAALQTGSGFVELVTTYLHPALMPEIIPSLVAPHSLGGISLNAVDLILKRAEKATSVILGPGMGNNPVTHELVARIIESIPESIPILLDADALVGLDVTKRLRPNLVLTPHVGELSAMIDIPREMVEENIHQITVDRAEEWGTTIVAKNVPTIISNGKKTFWNLTGNSGLAKAGSGDVLAGIIASLLSRNIHPLEAGAMGCFLHGKVAEYVARTSSVHSISASALVTALPKCLPS